MNVLLWVLQIALAWLCIAGGIFQMFKIEQLRKSLPDGVYQFKVVATDLISNATEALMAQVFSYPVIICNTPPKISVICRRLSVTTALPSGCRSVKCPVIKPR